MEDAPCNKSLVTCSNKDAPENDRFDFYLLDKGWFGDNAYREFKTVAGDEIKNLVRRFPWMKRFQKMEDFDGLANEVLMTLQCEARPVENPVGYFRTCLRNRCLKFAHEATSTVDPDTVNRERDHVIRDVLKAGVPVDDVIATLLRRGRSVEWGDVCAVHAIMTLLSDHPTWSNQEIAAEVPGLGLPNTPVSADRVRTFEMDSEFIVHVVPIRPGLKFAKKDESPSYDLRGQYELMRVIIREGTRFQLEVLDLLIRGFRKEDIEAHLHKGADAIDDAMRLLRLIVSRSMPECVPSRRAHTGRIFAVLQL